MNVFLVFGGWRRVWRCRRRCDVPSVGLHCARAPVNSQERTLTKTVVISLGQWQVQQSMDPYAFIRSRFRNCNRNGALHFRHRGPFHL